MHWKTKILFDSLYCAIHFIEVIRNATHDIFEVCLHGQQILQETIYTKGWKEGKQANEKTFNIISH